MSYENLVRDVASASGETQATVKLVLGTLSKVVVDNAKKGEESPIPQLGVFYSKKVAARNGINPATKEPLLISARSVLEFRVSGKSRILSIG